MPLTCKSLGSVIIVLKNKHFYSARTHSCDGKDIYTITKYIYFKKCRTFEFPIHQRFMKKNTVSTKILRSTTVYNVIYVSIQSFRIKSTFHRCSLFLVHHKCAAEMLSCYLWLRDFRMTKPLLCAFLCLYIYSHLAISVQCFFNAILRILH